MSLENASVSIEELYEENPILPAERYGEEISTLKAYISSLNRRAIVTMGLDGNDE
jgi:hypothetical protein